MIIRNPRLVPAEELRAAYGAEVTETDLKRLRAAKAALDEGISLPPEDNLVTEDDTRRGYAFIAKLVVAWHVYDATSAEKDQPLLPLPATPELVAKLPAEILTRIMQEVQAINPQQTPATQTATTGLF